MRNYPKRGEAKHLVVEWYDIQDDDDWNDSGSDYFYAHHCVSSGWLIYEDKFVIIIARTYSEDDDSWAEKRAIPKGCIIDTHDQTDSPPVSMEAAAPSGTVRRRGRAKH